jgi:hypothetical protein
MTCAQCILAVLTLWLLYVKRLRNYLTWKLCLCIAAICKGGEHVQNYPLLGVAVVFRTPIQL